MDKKLDDLIESALAGYREDTKIFIQNNYFMQGVAIGMEVASMWMLVKDELPEVDRPVLVVTNKGKYVVAQMYTPKDCYGNVLGEKEWKGSALFKESIVAWQYCPEFGEENLLPKEERIKLWVSRKEK